VAASVVSRTLQRAAEILGGRDKLSRQLRVPAKELDRWIADETEPPRGVFLRAVDIVLEETPAPGSSEPGDPPSPRDASSANDSGSAEYL